MNYSSLFSYEESSAWDIKEIRKRLIVPPDQLIKLNSMPEWTKVQDNRNTLQLDKDFSIESSQCTVNVAQNSRSINNNTKLFNEQIENHKSVLETYKVYGSKLTRSLSLLTIDQSSENLSTKTVKRASSLPNVHQLSNASDINAKLIRCKNSAEKCILFDLSNKAVSQRQLEYILPTRCKISHSESQRSKENSETMETISPLPVNIPTVVEKPTIIENNGMLPGEKADQPMKHVIESVSDDAINSHSEIAKEPVNIPTVVERPTIVENNGMLPAEKADQPMKHVIESVSDDAINSHSKTAKELNNDSLHTENGNLYSETVKKNDVLLIEDVAAHSSDMSDQPKHAAESLNADKSDLHSETTKESNDVLHAVNVIQFTNNASNEPAKTANDALNVNSVSPLKKLAASCVPVVDGNHEPDLSIIKEIPACNISAFASERATSSLDVQAKEKYPSSELTDTNETSSLVVKETISENCSTSMANASDVPANYFGNAKSSAPILDGSDSPIISKSAEEITCSEKELGMQHLIRNCNSDVVMNDSGSDIKMENEENNQKECDYSAKYIKVKSVENDQRECESAKPSTDNETSSAKKRKLESRNKRSKRHRSEEKQGTLKIRSIKKVGEICYSSEEVKIMLDIMKQFS